MKLRILKFAIFALMAGFIVQPVYAADTPAQILDRLADDVKGELKNCSGIGQVLTCKVTQQDKGSKTRYDGKKTPPDLKSCVQCSCDGKAPGKEMCEGSPQVAGCTKKLSTQCNGVLCFDENKGGEPGTINCFKNGVRSEDCDNSAFK